MDIDPREFGRLESKVESIEARLIANTAKLDDIHEFVNRQKGAANVLLLLSTAVSALVGWLVSALSR